VYGMNEKIGQVAFPREESQFGPADRLYSNATAEIMDAEVYIYIHVCMYIYILVCMYLFMYIHMYLYTLRARNIMDSHDTSNMETKILKNKGEDYS
jgi:hypothetical protein